MTANNLDPATLAQLLQMMGGGATGGAGDIAYNPGQTFTGYQSISAGAKHMGSVGKSIGSMAGKGGGGDGSPAGTVSDAMSSYSPGSAPAISYNLEQIGGGGYSGLTPGGGNGGGGGGGGSY